MSSTHIFMSVRIKRYQWCGPHVVNQKRKRERSKKWPIFWKGTQTKLDCGRKTFYSFISRDTWRGTRTLWGIERGTWFKSDSGSFWAGCVKKKTCLVLASIIGSIQNDSYLSLFRVCVCIDTADVHLFTVSEYLVFLFYTRKRNRGKSRIKRFFLSTNEAFSTQTRHTKHNNWVCVCRRGK